ncbi:hypothetical protein FS749_014835 [Ceratobasidium sp. UAMH 11750]|nr:hypothetical protein FS749_014835 [Ceratobasidium sp. UAMH 11750]
MPADTRGSLPGFTLVFPTSSIIIAYSVPPDRSRIRRTPLTQHATHSMSTIVLGKPPPIRDSSGALPDLAIACIIGSGHFCLLLLALPQTLFLARMVSYQLLTNLAKRQSPRNTSVRLEGGIIPTNYLEIHPCVLRQSSAHGQQFL